MEQAQVPETVSFNDTTYQLSELPAPIKEFIRMHSDWNVELAAQRREVFKTEAALRGLRAELEVRFTAFEAAKIEAAKKLAEAQSTEAQPAA
jgi:hypothetical protein